jgi:23S rRNA pseudouridine2605 synthase
MNKETGGRGRRTTGTGRATSNTESKKTDGSRINSAYKTGSKRAPKENKTERNDDFSSPSQERASAEAPFRKGTKTTERFNDNEDKPFKTTKSNYTSDKPRTERTYGAKKESLEGRGSYDKPRTERIYGAKKEGYTENRSSSYDKPFRKPAGSEDGDKPFRPAKKEFGEKKEYTGRVHTNKINNNDREKSEAPFRKTKPSYAIDKPKGYEKAPLSRKGKDGFVKQGMSKGPKTTQPNRNSNGMVRLNKYIANTGICSRREADELIGAGLVMINGVVITEMGYQVGSDDEVKYGGSTIRKEKLVYLLLNKPKDFITTTDDPMDRRTVMALVQDACKERIYPVGRLDRSTTGLLLLTNDGELTKRLTHPSYNIRKIYHVELDKSVKLSDLKKIEEGMELEDGFIKVDSASYVGAAKNEVGVEIHSGKNRIVRRIFESLEYKVRKLDRVYFAGLTKKDLPRGRWRMLSEMEINMLRMQTGKKGQLMNEFED